MTDKLARKLLLGGAVAAGIGTVALLKWLDDNADHLEDIAPANQDDYRRPDTPVEIRIDTDDVDVPDPDDLTLDELLDSIETGQFNWTAEMTAEIDDQFADDLDRVTDNLDAFVNLVRGDYPDDLRETAADTLADAAEDAPDQFSDHDINRLLDALDVQDPDLRDAIQDTVDELLGEVTDPAERSRIEAQYQAILADEASELSGDDPVEIEVEDGGADEEAESGTDAVAATPEQCAALTNSGSRCSRDAKDGERYCGQHLKKVEEDGADAVTDYDEA